MKNLHKILVLLSLTMIISCTDDSKNPLPDFAASQGAFIRFVDEIAPPTVSFAVPAEASISLPVEDVNGNTTSYSLDMIATVGGNVSIIDDFITIDSFPATLTISAQMIADALNIPLNDLDFGDNFAFVAEAVRNDGVAFTGQVPVFDGDTGILSGGNTSANLLTGVYRNAMAFNFTFACPVFTTADVVGTYDVLNFSFGATFPITTATREIIAGPGDGQITIVGGEYPDYGADDLVLNVNFTTGTVSRGADGIAFDAAAGAFATDNYGDVSGLVLPCAGGLINLVVDFDAFAGNAHPFNLQKQ
ncbi:hypothetical protein [Aquimarina sp. BL5]|uniref:hypothetical protein n=1 Tax=Aquimarina sp. BL5 TaxID=1714860 RepID=UPI0011C39252|nr:hypothetical protein [Aquimarina sp. BL5]